MRMALQIPRAKSKSLFDFPQAQQQHLWSPGLDAPSQKFELEQTSQRESQVEG